MPKRNLGRMTHADADQLKALCLLFYEETDVAVLQRRIELDAGVSLNSLAPWILDILGIIAYARRHVAILEHLVKTHRASKARAKTTFDLISVNILTRRRHSSIVFQHSADTPQNRETEWRMWTALLNAEPGAWLHYPLLQTKSGGLPAGLYHGIHWLADYWSEDHELRESATFASFITALNLRDVVLGAHTISRFLSVTEGSSVNFPNGGPFIPFRAATARMMLECFPLEESLSDDNPAGDSAELALPISQWPLDNPDRLAVMEILLKQGLVVDGRVVDYGNYMYGQPEEQLQDTCLIKAAERGDTDMVDLLVRYGARTDVKGAHGHTAAQRARSKGHFELAERLEGL